eukprot:XP_001706180.1 Hypothetical protein GL50803_39064 [Giardia lamblia ATCC 50803]
MPRLTNSQGSSSGRCTLSRWISRWVSASPSSKYVSRRVNDCQ